MSAQKKTTAKKKRTRRTPEQQVADLQARIAAIKERAERKKVRKDPALRHISAALRSIDKALGECGDKATRGALQEARATLSACLSLSGAAAPSSRRAVAPADPGAVLRYVRENPGSKAEQIAGALGLDGKAVSAALKQLKGDERVRSEGRARGTTYFAS